MRVVLVAFLLFLAGCAQPPDDAWRTAEEQPIIPGPGDGGADDADCIEPGTIILTRAELPLCQLDDQWQELLNAMPDDGSCFHLAARLRVVGFAGNAYAPMGNLPPQTASAVNETERMRLEAGLGVYNGRMCVDATLEYISPEPGRVKEMCGSSWKIAVVDAQGMQVPSKYESGIHCAAMGIVDIHAGDRKQTREMWTGALFSDSLWPPVGAAAPGEYVVQVSYWACSVASERGWSYDEPCETIRVELPLVVDEPSAT